MIISSTIYNEIVYKTPKPPPEIGGVLFQRNDIVSHYVIDEGLKEYGKYTPNVDFLNHQIELMAKKEYEFCGIFHTHFPFGEKLSSDDEKYINRIALSLKNQIDTLYFPIVLPNDKMVAYCSCFSNGDVIISGDNLVII